jgi:hypothetical protein
MGLFDGYFDQDQFQDGGGLLGRLLSLQQRQGQYQPGAGFDQAPSVAQTQAPPSMPSPTLLNNMQASAVSPMGMQGLRSQYAALAPILGDHSAMIATINPEMGKTMVAQALASQQPDNTANVVSTAYGLGEIRTPPIGPFPPSSIPMPAIPDWWKDVGYPRMMSDIGGATTGGLDAIILKNRDQPPQSGDKPASTPIGRRGNPIDVKRGTNQPTTIGGRIYSGRAADQMQGRGISPSAVEETIQNGQTGPGNGPGETEHTGTNGVKVVTGADGQVITVITVER